MTLGFAAKPDVGKVMIVLKISSCEKTFKNKKYCKNTPFWNKKVLEKHPHKVSKKIEKENENIDIILTNSTICNIMKPLIWV